MCAGNESQPGCRWSHFDVNRHLKGFRLSAGGTGDYVAIDIHLDEPLKWVITAVAAVLAQIVQLQAQYLQTVGISQ